MTKVCCICKRVKAADSWIAGKSFADDEAISHGYCPVCFDGVMVEIEHYMNSRRRMRGFGTSIQEMGGN